MTEKCPKCGNEGKDISLQVDVISHQIHCYVCCNKSHELPCLTIREWNKLKRQNLREEKQ